MLSIRQALITMIVVCIAIFVMMWAIRPASAASTNNECTPGSKYCKCDNEKTGTGCFIQQECGELETGEPCANEHPRPVRFRPWQEIWQCNDLRVTVTSNAPGIVKYDIAGSIWGGINFTFDGPRHQLYKGAWPCALVR